MLQIPGLHIRHTVNKGRGVFTSIKINIGDTIEIAPVIVLPKSDIVKIDKTILYEYYFIWNLDPIKIAIGLGLTSLYNHSTRPNAKVILDHRDDTIIIECINTIEAEDEIYIDYLDQEGGDKKLWFEEK